MAQQKWARFMSDNLNMQVALRRELAGLSLEELADSHAQAIGTTQQTYEVEILRRQAQSEIDAAEATAKSANDTRRMVFWVMVSAIATAVSAIAGALSILLNLHF
jgi:ActR/RegA family two-component response regulator